MKNIHDQTCLFQLRIHQMATEMKLQPFAILLRNTLDQLQEIDSGRIFAEPVDRDEVGYRMLHLKFI